MYIVYDQLRTLSSLGFLLWLDSDLHSGTTANEAAKLGQKSQLRGLATVDNGVYSGD